MVERLEDRRLLSDTWSTEDQFVPFNPGFQSFSINEAMAADADGNVYAVGDANDYEGADRDFAVIRRKTGPAGTWQTIGMVEGSGVDGRPTAFYSVAVAPTGELYLTGAIDSQARIWKGTWIAGSLSLSVVESRDNFTHYRDVAVDAAGNTFAIGSVTVRKGNSSTAHWMVWKQTGGVGAFRPVDDFLFNGTGSGAQALTVVNSGSAAGVYVVGFGANGTSAGGHWIVRKSGNAGATWGTVDAFQLDPATKAPAYAWDITSHEDGTLHAVGTAATGVRTGGTNKNPTYTYTHRWFMRSSTNGGAAWTGQDVHPGADPVNPRGVTTDLAGNVYLTGSYYVGDVSHSIVRTNAGGSWTTSDDFAYEPGSYGAEASCMTRDAAGTIYVGGQLLSATNDQQGWFVRSMSPSASPATFSSAPITDGASSLLGLAEEESDDELVIEAVGA
jgi:hypothetical protein